MRTYHEQLEYVYKPTRLCYLVDQVLDSLLQGIIERDEIVFRKARHLSIPIFMVLSGGYQRVTARVIADSILNLRSKGLIACAEAEDHIQLATI